MVPDDSFIGHYMAAMDAQETPRGYDFWTACWCLGVALGRTLVVARPRAPVHLNLYLILAAQSGVTRKSTAVRFASTIVQDYIRLHAPWTAYVGGSTNKDAIELRLAEQTRNRDTSDLVVCSSELVTFMGKDLVTMQIPGLMTDLYDCPSYRPSPGTVRSGTRDLKNVYVNFLSASTPSWLMRSVHADVVEGGFTSRCLFIVEEEPKRRTVWPTQDDRQDSEGGIGSLVQRLADIKQRASDVIRYHEGISISEGALRRLTNWYKSRPIHLDPYRSSFEAREDHHILRLAAILCINDGTWIIQDTHIRTAIQVIIHVKEAGAGLFSGSSTASRLGVGVEKVRKLLVEGGLAGITQSDLLKGVRPTLNAAQLQTLLIAMKELDLVQQFTFQLHEAGKPTTMWRATKALAKSNAVDAVKRTLEDLV